MKKTHSIRTKLVMLAIIPMLLIAFILLGYALIGGMMNITSALKDSMNETAKISAHAITNQLVTYETAVNEMLEKIGHESKFINGLRYTDEVTIKVVQQVLAGQVNKDLVARLKGKGVGLCGMDGQMMHCTKKITNDGTDLGYVGFIEQVDTDLINDLMDKGYIPVIASVGLGDDGTAYNLNADTAAAEIAIALQAEKFVSMTDIAGILMDKNDESTLISSIEIGKVPELMEKGIIAGGMIPKVKGMVNAINQGVHEVSIIDGRVLHSVLLENFSDQGSGTLLYKKAE